MASLRKDIVTAYLAAGVKVASWVIVSAIVFRISADSYAMLTLVKGTIGLLAYTSLGLGPAMIHMLGESRRAARPAIVLDSPPLRTLEYKSAPDPALVVYANGRLAGLVIAVAGILLVFIYTLLFNSIHSVPTGVRSIHDFVFLMGLGTVLRLRSDVEGAVIQTRRSIALDNLFLLFAEVAWVIIVAALVRWTHTNLSGVGAAYAISGGLLLLLRSTGIPTVERRFRPGGTVNVNAIKALLAFGFLVAMAQLADFLYAPTDFILINRLLNNLDLAAYGPAVQIDAGLLLLVSGIAAVLLPRTAIAHAADDHKTIRDYYVRGTLGSTAALAVAAASVWATAHWLLKLWLGAPLPLTFTILPLVLIHTVVGGSSAVGRSILLGLGKVKPFTIAVLIAGVSNVLLSFTFVYYFHLGLIGIILGTITAVVGRCAIWMPWYVWRTLKNANQTEFTDETETVSPPMP